MKIQTISNGRIEIPKAIKYMDHNGRKIAVHRFYSNNEFMEGYFSSTDYATGMQISWGYCISELIKDTKIRLNSNPNFDYSKYKIINK